MTSKAMPPNPAGAIAQHAVLTWQARDADRLARQDARRAAEALAAIPRRFRRPFSALDRSMCPEAYDACLAYAKTRQSANGKPGLILRGPPGTGKSTLAGAILVEAVQRGLTRVEFGDISLRLEQIRVGRDKQDGDTGRRDSLLSLAEQELVVLDDLGRQRLTHWSDEQIYVLINALYSDCRPVVITSNLTTEFWEGKTSKDAENEGAYLNESVRSRIEEMCEPVVLGGTDLRPKWQAGNGQR